MGTVTAWVLQLHGDYKLTVLQQVWVAYVTWHDVTLCHAASKPVTPGHCRVSSGTTGCTGCDDLQAYPESPESPESPATSSYL
eukprot:1261764-Amorphochlora_amoeboformis.AAC.1